MSEIVTICANCGHEEGAHVAPNAVCPINVFKSQMATTLGQWIQFDGAFIHLSNPKTTFTSVALTEVDQNGHSIVHDPATAPTFSTYQSFVRASPLALAGDVCGVADWNGSWEYHRVPAIRSDGSLIQGVRWGWVDGFGNPAGAFWPLEILRADWVNVGGNGSVLDITPPKGMLGSPFCIFDIPLTGTYRRRTWGWTCNSTTPGDRANQFYEQIDFVFGANMGTNAAWTGTIPNRPGIRAWDAWWSVGTWVAASCPNHPFDDAGNPVVPNNVSYERSDVMAIDAGALWDYRSQGWVVALKSIA